MALSQNKGNSITFQKRKTMLVQADKSFETKIYEGLFNEALFISGLESC